MTKAARLATANPGQWNRPQLFAVRLWKLRRHHLERLAEEPRPETEQIWFLVPIGARRQSISLELRIRRRERIKILRRRGICVRSLLDGLEKVEGRMKSLRLWIHGPPPSSPLGPRGRQRGLATTGLPCDLDSHSRFSKNRSG
ncbi:hypothetical protein [Bradyrhizobium sp.]|uniref:hypothetical protein n=1 Tax=Bradyrhizobium sp. TaxID=376 RepID=UPI002BB4D8E7|nr:hypothetical protein [Bradyrhizobium sp.]HWX62019.1 hypothetical protein [Bradyrhizobium sp.]